MKDKATLFKCKRVVLALILLVVVSAACSSRRADSLQNNYPEFSWDHIPRYMHVWDKTSFTDEELDYLAEFHFITFEKWQGTLEGSVQEGTLKAARAVKERNPKAKILYYKNIVIDWPSAMSKELETIEGGHLQSQDGTVPIFYGAKFCDISLPEVQEWWIRDATQMLEDPSIEGLFVDANMKILVEAFFAERGVGPDKIKALRVGYDKILTEINKDLRPDNIILANLIRARLEDGGLGYLGYFDGSYLEGFLGAVGGVSKKDYVAKGITCAQEAARQGKIVAFCNRLSVQPNEGTDIDEAGNPDSKLNYDPERLDYLTAIFLVIAEKYSYLYIHGGYGVGPESEIDNPFWLETLPVFEKRLGPPKGAATRDGYIYTREFEHCSVWLDIENETAKLTWR
ncbi:putative glycoside hydrolase [Planctomycetota bacterium]